MNSPTLFLLVNGISPEGKEYNLLHCNWGWDGYKNGYYYVVSSTPMMVPFLIMYPLEATKPHITDTIFSTH